MPHPHPVLSTFRITYYDGPRTRFSYVLANTQSEANRLADIYRQPGEILFRVVPFNI